ncbi:hypothetical protein [Clostridium estertheticum]|uniref:hypothetical protein n=1 Tax=Clostridium estertheticum TaxID=238834 RepID=UPI001C7CEC30|nr:hypothetical protein [Clostridium estertheticum]MBX4267168.1 hypothetical protein [Clostridium estertheticum]WLC91291.1 hypothetical protein KTC95_24105 [Clostridium estertheticum]
MESINIYAIKSEINENEDIDFDSDKVAELYYLQNKNVYIILSLFDIWFKDLNIDGGKFIEIKSFYKAKTNFSENHALIKELKEEYLETEDEIKYRFVEIQDFFDYIDKYLEENPIKKLYIETDLFT